MACRWPIPLSPSQRHLFHVRSAHRGCEPDTKPLTNQPHRHLHSRLVLGLLTHYDAMMRDPSAHRTAATPRFGSRVGLASSLSTDRACVHVVDALYGLCVQTTNLGHSEHVEPRAEVCAAFSDESRGEA